MANRARTGHRITERQQAETVVDLYLDVVFSCDGDAGWQGAGLIGKLVDFKGDLPQSSGFSGFEKVYNQSKKLASWSGPHKMAALVMHIISDRQREAVCIDRSYRGRTKVAVDPFVPSERIEIHWDDERCAEYAGCSANAFRKRVSEGYEAISHQLQKSVKKAA